jgi:hypothetical protein
MLPQNADWSKTAAVAAKKPSQNKEVESLRKKVQDLEKELGKSRHTQDENDDSSSHSGHGEHSFDKAV